MGKLGLVISIVSGGKTDPYNLNSDPEWSRMVIDLRDELINFSEINANNQLIRLSFTETGVLIATISTITGRVGDYKSAWIFIPYDLDISGKKMVQILDFTRKELSGSRIKEETLSSFFSEDYPIQEAPYHPQIPTQSNIAFRYYGGDTLMELYELLGHNILQSYYLGYTAVYLINKEDSNIRTFLSNNLTDKKIKDIVVVHPPKNNEGYTPYIGNNKFESPVSLMEGDIINISWRKEHYKTVDKQWQVVKGNNDIPDLTVMDYFYQVFYDDISIMDKQGRPITNYTLFVNQKQFDKGQNLFVHISSLKSCEITVSSEGYAEFKKTIDLSKAITICLEKLQYVYKFNIPLSNEFEGLYGEFELKTNNKLSKTPIEGYQSEKVLSPNKRNYLTFKPINKKRKIIIGVLMLIALCAGFCGGFYVSDLINKRLDDNNKKAEQGITNKTAENQSKPEKQATDMNNDAPQPPAIDYLDSNDAWMRNTMEQYPAMQGLWDALNERRFDDILEYEAVLSSSYKFNEVIKAVKDNKHKTSLQQNYNTSPNDLKITVDDYINKLNIAQEPSKPDKTASSKKTSTPKETKKENSNKKKDKQDEF